MIGKQYNRICVNYQEHVKKHTKRSTIISIICYLCNTLKNNKIMNKKYYLTAIFALSVFTILLAQANKIIQSDGLFFTDASQTKLYTGEYKEYFDNGELKLEMNIQNGKSEGAYIVYFQNGKPNEVRAYRNGNFHGVWKTFNEAGMLISQAEYRDNKKHGAWHIWDDSGIMRYEMHYDQGKKANIWYMWDEKGKLISEKKY